MTKTPIDFFKLLEDLDEETLSHLRDLTESRLLLLRNKRESLELSNINFLNYRVFLEVDKAKKLYTVQDNLSDTAEVWGVCYTEGLTEHTGFELTMLVKDPVLAIRHLRAIVRLYRSTGTSSSTVGEKDRVVVNEEVELFKLNPVKAADMSRLIPNHGSKTTTFKQAVFADKKGNFPNSPSFSYSKLKQLYITKPL
ncbi:MAG: hypothetical protein M0R77_01195 [Gammaproteobacteria bacterium]|nr:hypothetical protein [Acholeplasmataceae bacterium]MCK9529172.1 hypothetical protein [Gammaproteobacteria bacterium]